MTGSKWSKFQSATPIRSTRTGLTDASWLDYIEHFKAGRLKIWQNNRYQVQWHSPEMVRLAGMADDTWPDLIWLSLKRRDKSVAHDWRDLQRIKDEIVGHKHEAVELYPMRSRIVDSANQYHLWVLAEAGACFPIGYRARDVADSAQARAVGAIQRAFSEEHLSIITEDETP